jgi:hypothetical protein
MTTMAEAIHDREVQALERRTLLDQIQRYAAFYVSRERANLAHERLAAKALGLPVKPTRAQLEDLRAQAALAQKEFMRVEPVGGPPPFLPDEVARLRALWRDHARTHETDEERAGHGSGGFCTGPNCELVRDMDRMPDTRLCGAAAAGGPCVLPPGHNRGRADIPENHTVLSTEEVPS